jgi:hypothetical protein
MAIFSGFFSSKWVAHMDEEKNRIPTHIDQVRQ